MLTPIFPGSGEFTADQSTPTAPPNAPDSTVSGDTATLSSVLSSPPMTITPPPLIPQQSVTTLPGTIYGCGSAEGTGVIMGDGTVYVLGNFPKVAFAPYVLTLTFRKGYIPVVSTSATATGIGTAVGCGTVVGEGFFSGSATVIGCGTGTGMYDLGVIS